jgi:N-acetylmuramoyl-L-alanine amidase
MQIQKQPCAPENFRFGRPPGIRPEAIVIHISTDTLASADEWFNNSQAKVSAHYIVGKNGNVHQYVEENDTAFHAGTVVQPSWKLLKPKVNPNYYTIGIEHEGKESDVWPDLQVTTSAVLIGSIASRWGIPLDEDHVIPHHAIRATKTCPGSFVQILELLRRVPANAELPSPVASLTALTNLNLRSGAPSRSSRIVGVVTRGEMLSPVAVVQGDPVDGNALWYRDALGRYFWAGGTTVPNPEARMAAAR